MQVLFDSDVRVDFGSLELNTGVDTEGSSSSAGQPVGILGAVTPGLLVMSFGMHDGLIPVRVELHDSPPVLDDRWEDVAEASLAARGTQVRLSSFDIWYPLVLPASGWYRARWHDHGADAGHRTSRGHASEPVVESCLLQLWPAPPGPVIALRQTSASASYFAEVARTSPAPSSPYEQALAERSRLLDRVRAGRDTPGPGWSPASWGGRAPSARLLMVEADAVRLARRHRDLVDAIAALPASRQRQLARRCADALAAEADARPETGIHFVAALDHLDSHGVLPPPLADLDAAWAAMWADGWAGEPVWSDVPTGEASARSAPSHPAPAAVEAAIALTRRDALASALAAVNAAAWSAPDLEVYFADVRRRVRELAR